jgi:hypothetical protein
MEFEAPVVSVAEYGYFFKVDNHCHALLLIENASKLYDVGEVKKVKVKIMDAERQRCELDEC